MSVSRRLFAAILVAHVAALALAAVPDPTALEGVLPAGTAHSPPRLSSFLDSSVTSLAAVLARVWPIVAPATAVAHRYLGVAGLTPDWRMFQAPPPWEQYVRLRYYVGARGAPGSPARWAAAELVTPAYPQYRVRLVRGYLASAADKAMMIALADYHRRRTPKLRRSDTPAAELPDDLAPLVRYYTRRFERERLLEGEKVVRVEFWYGLVPVAPPGTLDHAVVNARTAAVAAYYGGDTDAGRTSIGRRGYPAYQTVEREVDIEWLLEYIEEL